MKVFSSLLLSCLLSAVLCYKDFVNVAKGKNTTQSSTGWDGFSYKAVDGSTSGRYWDRTCTHTNNEGHSWWEVDLGAVYKIDHILVYGRTDCCTDRLKGAKLWIGNNKCNTLRDMGSAQIDTLNCTDAADQIGRRVRIEALNYVTLCEVKVMVEIEVTLDAETATVTSERVEEHGDYVNIAIHRKAYQSSTKYNGWASRGNDGYTNGHWNYKTCTYTSNSGMNYWEIDLGRVYKIDHMKLYGRTDSVPQWLNEASVKVGGRVCQVLKDMEVNKTLPTTIDCDGDADKLIGQKVRIEKWATTVTVCELQIFVKPENLPDADDVIPTEDFTAIGQEIEGYVNVAHNKNASASTEPWGGVASRAVDGTTNQNWNLGSCTHTYNRGTEWWKVDLGRVYQIDHIRVWGRSDAHTDRIAGARLWIEEHRCGTLQDKGKTGGADVITCSKEESAGRYVMIETHAQYLTLCEVQVMVKKGQLDLVPDVVASQGEKIGNFTNVALRKEAYQSSVGWSGYAANGVDGWAMTKYSSYSCTHTHRGGVQSLTIDLGSNYKVDHVKFWGRSDCCQDRIKWARVYVGRTYCGQLGEAQYKAGQPWTMQCSQNETVATGRYVTVSKLNDYLTLCEVQVMVKNSDIAQYDGETPSTYPTWENVALFRNTSQSSVGWGGVSSRAVDGYPGKTKWNEASCTHTMKNPLSYWEVDLADYYHVNMLKVSGRADCCGDRLDGAVVTMDNKTVGGFSYYSGQIYWEIPLGNLKGRRIRIALPNEYLTLCEVQAWVNHDYDPSEDTNVIDLSLPNLALKKDTSNSGNDDSALAVDGNTEGNYYRGSCSTTGPTQGDHWWMVALGDSYNVGHIIVYPRLDMNYAKYIDGAQVKLDDQVCGTINWTAGTMHYKIDCDGKSGSVVKIVRSGGYLQLCEVVVQAAEE